MAGYVLHQCSHCNYAAKSSVALAHHIQDEHDYNDWYGIVCLTMSDEHITQEQADKEIQTQHVLQVALDNLNVVVDQLESLQDSRVEIVLEALDTAKTDLGKLTTP